MINHVEGLESILPGKYGTILDWVLKAFINFGGSPIQGENWDNKYALILKTSKRCIIIVMCL